MKIDRNWQENRAAFAVLVIYICFIFSGASGLIFEVAWSKALSLYLGNTLHAISTVVGAYMAGLGFGALLSGNFCGRLRYPIRTYGWIEGTVGIFGLVSPFVFDLLFPVFGHLSFLKDSSFTIFLIARFVIVFSILLIPTVAMGMTLPLLVSALTAKRPEFGSSVGKLYGLNTAGAVLGTVLGGFLLLPYLGLFKSIISASLLNLTILALIYLVPSLRNWFTHASERDIERSAAAKAGMETAPAGAKGHLKPEKRAAGVIILTLFAISGFLALVYEVGWTRVLSLTIGSSVYSFTIILATFLLGIALGSLIIARKAEKMKRPVLIFGILEVILGISTLAGTFFFYYIPQFFAVIIYKSHFNVKLIVAGEFLLSALISFIPCLIMGLLFPVAACAYRKSEVSAGKNIGRIYFFNTFGAIFGSIATGFILIPHIGILKTLILTSASSVLIGIIAFFSSEIQLKPKILSSGLALSFTFFLSVLVPSWDIGRMNRGLIQIIRDIKTGDISGGVKKEEEILYYKEGKNATVAVSYVGSDMYLKIGGKIDASAVADSITQTLCAQIPLLYADNPKDVCVIGLGSGVSTYSVLTHPVRSVDTLEIEESVIEASGYFYPVNHDPLSDPRSTIIVEDARSYLSYTDKKYDVIISEPSNPWIAGINSLFTADFYEIINKKLNDGGVFSQWLQTYELSVDSLATIMRTMNSKFHNCHFYYITRGGDSLLIAKKGKIELDFAKVSRFFENEKVARDLRKINITNPFDFSTYYIAPLTEIVRALGKGTINTDDNSYIEYRAPFELLSPKEREYSIAVGEQFIDETKKVFFPDLGEGESLLNLGLSFLKLNDKVRTDFILARLKSRNYEKETSTFIEEIRKMEEVKANEKKGYDLFNRAEEAFRAENNSLASDSVMEALALAPHLDDLAFNGALMLLNLGKLDEAEKILKEIIKREPFAYTYTSYLNLGSLYWNRKEPDRGIEYYQKAIDYNPYFTSGYVQIARAYAMKGEKEQARQNLLRALKLNPANSQARELLNSI
ncbi:MAG: fused MFS/spermidine synthase [Acidobacteriota bacterium]